MKNIKAQIIVFALAVAVLVASQSSAAVLLDRIIAVVNNEAITWGQLYRAMEFDLSNQMKSLTAEQKKAVFDQNKSTFLENMINEKLQLQEAKRLHIGITPPELNAAINEIKTKYHMTDTQFVQALQQDGFSLDEYRKMLTDQLVIAKLVEVAVKSEINITDKDLKDLPKDDAFLRIRQIFIKDGPEAQEKADKVIAELEAGGSFARLAKQYSDGPQASTGGDLGLVQKSKMAGAFAKALSGLKPGDYSKPFKTSDGIHILTIVESRSVRDVLAEQRLDEAYADWLRGLRENSFIDIRL